MPITFKPDDSFSFADEQGNEILVVSFDMDKGANLVTIYAYDTDGHPIFDIGIAYLGPGYPQCGSPDSQHFINQVERSSLPEYSARAHRIVRPARPIETKKRELDEEDPQYAALVP